MAAPRSPRRRLVSIGALVLVAAAWTVWLRPTALGGSVSYVVVQGESMEPTYEDGDLVLVREESEYHHGDVIAFRAGGQFDDPTRVIHRIVGGSVDDGFATQGDNRDRLDPWSPLAKDIIGRAVLHVPMAGDVASTLTSPASFAALGGAAVVAGGERERRRRRRRRTANPPARPAVPSRAAHVRAQPPLPAAAPRRLHRLSHPRWAFVGLVVSAVLALPVLAVTWSALRAPDATQRVEQTGQVDSGIDLDYRFTGPASTVYPTGEVGATRNVAGSVVPDGPLYSKLLSAVEVQLAFRASETGAERLAGTYAIDVVVETPGGWSTSLEAIPSTPFEGTATEQVDIDLQAVAAKVAEVAQLTGVGGADYTIAITPTLHVEAAAGPTDVVEDLAAPLQLAVEGNLITATAVEKTSSTPLTETFEDRSTYSLGPLELTAQAARGVLGGLALVLVAGLAWFASVLFAGVGLDEPSRIAARYRSQIVDVAAAAAPPGPVVMVGAIDELARIAKVEQAVILHEDLGDGGHRYRVFLGTVTYEYETAPEHAGAAADPAEPATDPTDG